jgi:molybdopterin molybdotransferase
MAQLSSLTNVQKALDIWLHAFPSGNRPVETIETRKSLGRVTGAPVYAPIPLPEFSRSAMDGYAVRAADTYGATENLPVSLPVVGEVPMGDRPQFRVEAGQAALIHTGGMIPEGADAVAMIETTRVVSAGKVEIRTAVTHGENVILAGEDVKKGDEVIPAGRRIRPEEIGGLMAFGMTMVQVVVPPRIGVLSSGDEVVRPEEQPRLGQVRDINTASLSSYISSCGAIPVEYGIVPDRRDLLQSMVTRAYHECDAVVVTAGSSASVRDITADVIQTLGAPGVLVHGVNVRPGKPTILAVCGNKPVIGMPGNPISALVIARLFLEPMITAMLGRESLPVRAGIQARMAKNMTSIAGREEWIPVILKTNGGVVTAEPVFFKSNLIFNLVQADGLAYIPAERTGVNAGEEIKVIPL